MEYKELGLTTNESKVYDTLLRLGRAAAAHISKESQVPYGRIYTVLESLEEKGFVRTIPEGTKKYVATDPERFSQIIDTKIKALMEIDNKVKEMKKIYEENAPEPVIIAKGKANFYKINKESKTAEKYAYSIKYTFEPNPVWMRSTKEKIEKGIDYKTIGSFNKDTENAIEEWKKINPNIKPINNEGVAMGITDDEEVMIGLIKSNTTMLIRDKPFAKLMKELFIKYYINTQDPEMK